MTTVRITFPVDPAETPERYRLIHIIRNFGEELSLTLSRNDLAELSMNDVDVAIDRLVVRIKAKRKVKRVLKRIGEMLEKHLLQNSATVILVSDPA
ncbi:hypothetical protein JQ557_11725 [Bradyrhizobium sp. U87765 SZCCT0131]|uniref:hypothetical protein n=1 Tax=unclassified Bradyrhizobium TaxID=2631580 RepID=UPI001BA5EB15|nr:MULTISPECIES: hypothetical protein [unclassified Bradyrhizobium]MBR1218661.1 hypothetical protein [Bradyrhizobium sp. U87765 SZCCT0131]MBR1265580.1 hypothetical protein [Bradyrhizobium sp. U87765 SZCCT0134]MBR1304159.1 hypothetical protein [Bradyrhizobium sp. U87765 SZCCT0110]MBR1319765.1 hypothetical protein [Bradyrhizobium sp. U87765 SZCCT0109]MBR1348090.1 hypothetical protein [Bradyrhizobium sp. U87765 SZCCT0048]